MVWCGGVSSFPTATFVQADSLPARAAAALADVLHSLAFYVAAGIASLGWALCQFAGWDAAPWLPLWFCAALLLYNADRLWLDPADAVNLPARNASFHRLRQAAVAVTAAAGAVLLTLPVLRHDWLTVGLILAGSLACLNYSRPLLGFRFKDLPLLKTLFAPTVIMGAFLSLPWLHQGPATFPLLLPALHFWGLMLFNMTLCDWRDLAGDRQTGIRSIPAVLHERTLLRMLWALAFVVEALTIGALIRAGPAHAAAWALLCALQPVCLAGLLIAIRRPRPEAFYEWWVEGLLFLPAMAVWTGCR